MKNKLKIHISTLLCILLLLSSVYATQAVEAEPQHNSQENILQTSSDIKSDKVEISRFAIDSEPQKDIILPTKSNSLPSYYNGIEEGYVTSVKNQKNHNTCWAFAGIATLESHLLKKGYGEYDFSEEHMNLWASTRNNGTGWQRDYEGSGYALISPGYFTSFSGIANEQTFPYDTLQNAKYEDLHTVTPEYGVTEIEYITNDINLVKDSIYNNGAVYANCNVSTRFFNSTSTALNCNEYTSANAIYGHVVTIVGWDDFYSKDNFNPNSKPINNGAWLVKNSWGENYAKNGYFWISYEDKYILNPIFGDSYTIKTVEQLEPTDKLYQHDEYGSTYNMKIFENIDGNSVYQEDLTFINVFDFSTDDRILDNVIFESESVGSTYTVYLTPIVGTAPIKDKSEWTKLQTGTIDYKGYHSIDIKNFSLPRTKFGIAVTINSENCDAFASIGVSETVFNSSANKTTFKPNPNKNDGFIYFNNNMYEFLDFYKTTLNDNINTGSITIKALTSYNDSLMLGDIDGDKSITLTDCLTLQLYISKYFDADSVDFTLDLANCDTLQDGNINLKDLLQLQTSMVLH